MSLNIDSSTPSTSPRRSSHTRAQTHAPPASRSHLSPTPSSKSKQPRAPWRSPSSSSLSVSLSPFRPGLSPPSTTNVQVTKVVAQPELSGEGRVGAAEVAAKAAANSASASLLDIAEGSSRSSTASRSRSGSRSQSVTGSIGRNGMMRRSSRSVLGEGGLQSLEGRLKSLDEGVTVSSPEGVAESELTSNEGPQRIPTLMLTPSNDLPPEAQQQASTSSISSTSPSQAEKDNNITSHDAAPRSLAAEPISSMTAPPSSLGSQPSISSLTSAPSSLSSPPPPPPSTSSGNSTSWFASFSRSKGKRAVSALSNSSAATSKSAPLPNTTSTPASEVPGATSFAASTDALVVGQMDLEVFNATPEPPAAIPSDQESLANTPAARRTGDAVDEEFPAVVAITEAFPIPASIASPVKDKRDVASAPIPEDLSIAAPPVPAAASSTLATSPKKRSWFYSSPKSNSSQSSLVTKPSPLSQPAITAPAIVPPAAEVLPAVSSPSSTLSPPSTTTTLVDSDATIKALSPSKLKAKAKPDLQLVLSTANVVAGPTSIASSIDDVVPSLPSTPNPGQSAQSIISPPVSGKLFTLSLPLLGRTKIPLGVAAGSASDGLRTQDNATTD
ncbi:hypothetical protein BKA70DRAFT_387423 [Coprinopsis sp. MPI-PUGE-AT-0042]|nr:hypothetical protein BKA70DRAFT_387423 [Coprinopsis sp. MPI-PUGE-AT-0042]